MKIIHERIDAVSRVLKSIGLEVLLKLEEEDPQFTAVSRLASTLGKGPAMVYAILVSIVSYRLTMKGEEWWECLVRHVLEREPKSEYSLKHIVSDVIEYLRRCPGSILQREAKIKRVLKAYSSIEVRRLLQGLLEDPEDLDLKLLTLTLSRGLNARADSKTVAFAAKMAYYVYRFDAPRRVKGGNIAIPVDSRVACFTYSSKLIETRSYKDIVARPKTAQMIWNTISSKTGIPTVNLDVLAWRLGWIPRDAETLSRAREMILEFLSPYIGADKARWVSSELVVRLCK